MIVEQDFNEEMMLFVTGTRLEMEFLVGSCVGRDRDEITEEKGVAIFEH